MFVMLKNTMPLLEDDTIGHDLLKRLLLPLLAEHNPKIVEGCLGLLLHLLQEDCNAKMSLLLT